MNLPDVKGPHNPAPDQYAGLKHLVDTVFGEDNEGLWPHILSPDPNGLDRYLVYTDAGRVISAVGVIPMTFNVEGRTLPAGGISLVATDPAYRRQGLLTRLLYAAHARLVGQGVPLAWLNGDRALYRRHGYERAGRKYNLTFDRQALRVCPDPGLEVEALKRVEAVLPDLQRIYAERRLRGERSDDLAQKLFGRLGVRTWLAVDRGQVVGYMALTGGPADREAEIYEV